MKYVALLGSTGSIGTNTLHVARHLKAKIQIIALAAHSNIDLLQEQMHEFKPKYVAVFNADKAKELKLREPSYTILSGMEGLLEIVSLDEVNFVVAAMSGTLGLEPTLKAISCKKTIGLANKEVLVCAGELVTKLAREHQVKLLPIDSEHSALFQCMEGEDPNSIKRLIITASGGPFRKLSTEQLKHVTLEDALKHPTWQMGAKVTVDSSTLLNKGLEVIEARWLFDIPPEKIDVVIHPQSIVHSMVEFIDGSIKAQLSNPSMIMPIQHALTYPKRELSSLPSFDFTKSFELEFTPPDTKKFICLELALESLRKGGSFSCFLNAANEILVNRFLNKEITWYSIAQKLEKLMSQHSLEKELSLENILAVDAEARKRAATA